MSNMQFECKAPTALHHTLSDIPRYDNSKEKTPLQILVTNAYAKAYNYVCVPLTNENWRSRWREMCVTIGEHGSKNMLVEQRAEVWRAGGGFKQDEVHITRLGMQILCNCVNAVLISYEQMNPMV
jgi:type II protein arginine methyltransferase